MCLTYAMCRVTSVGKGTYPQVFCNLFGLLMWRGVLEYNMRCIILCSYVLMFVKMLLRLSDKSI